LSLNGLTLPTIDLRDPALSRSEAGRLDLDEVAEHERSWGSSGCYERKGRLSGPFDAKEAKAHLAAIAKKASSKARKR